MSAQDDVLCTITVAFCFVVMALGLFFVITILLLSITHSLLIISSCNFI